MKNKRRNIILLSSIMFGLVSCATSITTVPNSSNVSTNESILASETTDAVTSISTDQVTTETITSVESSENSSSYVNDTAIYSEEPVTSISSSSSFETSSNSSSMDIVSSNDIYSSSDKTTSITSSNSTSSWHLSSSSTIISLSEIDSSEEVIPDPVISYNGIYKGVLNNGDTNYKINNSNIVTIEIMDTSLKINNLEAAIIEYDNYYGYTLSLNNKLYKLSYIDSDEEKALTLELSDEENDYYVDYAYRIDSNITLPDSYVGTFTGNLNDSDEEVTLNGSNRLTIKISTNSITINNIKADLISFDEYYGIELLLNGLKYYLDVDTSFDGINVLTFRDDYNTYYSDLVIRNGYVIEE